MKNQTNKLTFLNLALLLLIIVGCEHQDDFKATHEHEGENPNIVSFDFFQETTEIYNIDQFLRNTKPFNKNNNLIDFDDFFINTDYIYQCILDDGGVSFSFDIEPIQECLPTEEFNLVIKKDENDNWYSRIFKLTSNTDGSSQNRFSSIDEIFSVNGLPNGITKRFEYHWEETIENSCIAPGNCNGPGGSCDWCSDCTTTTISLVTVFAPNLDDSMSSPDFNYNGGSGGGGSSGMAHQTERNLLINSLDLQPASQQHSYISRSATLDEMNILIAYLNENSIISKLGSQDYTQESKDFVNELIMRLRWDSSGDDLTDLRTLNLMIIGKNQDKFYNPIDDNFISSIDPFIDIDTTNCCGFLINYIIQQYLNFKGVSLIYEHPDWSLGKVMWETYRELVHINLDALGLVPVFGEPADIINGVIYTFEGDGLNAGLSFAGAIPFVGWLSTGSKIVIKVEKKLTSGLVGLVWDVGPDGLINFGSRNILRNLIDPSLLSSIVGSWHAHHIVSHKFWDHSLVQKAANSDGGFNINEAINGIPLPSSLHLNGHNSVGGYSDVVEDILTNTPGIDNFDNNQSYAFLTGLIDHIKQLIQANPDLNMGEIANLINYP